MPKISLRKHFAQLLTNKMEKNKNIWLLVGDVGYGVWDEAREKFPDRCFNYGAAEQAMIGTAVGLALAGKIPFVYTITPFLIYRPFETIRNYLHHEQNNVKLIGSGRNKDYGNNGFSHHATEDKKIMKQLAGIHSHWPSTQLQVTKVFNQSIKSKKPFYINLPR